LTISKQNDQFKKYKIPLKKDPIEKLISRRTMQRNTLSRQDEETKAKFMLKILEKIHVGSRTGYGSGPEKNNSGSTTMAYVGHKFCLYLVDAFLAHFLNVLNMTAISSKREGQLPPPQRPNVPCVSFFFSSISFFLIYSQIS
jgi:hypothetical protein